MPISQVIVKFNSRQFGALYHSNKLLGGDIIDVYYSYFIGLCSNTIPHVFVDAVLGDDVPESIQEITQELEKPRRKKKTGRVVASRLMNTTAAHRAKSTQQVTVYVLYVYAPGESMHCKVCYH